MRGLPLLFLVLALGAILWLLLSGGPADEDLPAGEPAVGRGGERAPVGSGPAEPGPAPRTETPSEGIARIGVLRPGEPPPFVSDPPLEPDVVIRLARGPDAEAPTGKDLLEAVTKIAYLRAHRAEDLEGLDEVAPPPDWSERVLHLEEVLQLYREHGYDLVPAGLTLLVHRRPLDEDDARAE